MTKIGKMRQYCWQRAHEARSAKWRTFWFDQFDACDGLFWVGGTR